MWPQAHSLTFKLQEMQHQTPTTSNASRLSPCLSEMNFSINTKKNNSETLKLNGLLINNWQYALCNMHYIRRLYRPPFTIHITRGTCDVTGNTSSQINVLYKAERIWGFYDNADSYCEVLNIAMCVLASVWNVCTEDEDNIFFRNLGSYDKTARRHRVGIYVVCVLYRRELNSEVLCG